jgi:hypothetical protein
LMERWLQLWKVRNEERHGRDLNERSRVRQEILRHELNELYTLRNDVAPADRTLFFPTIDQHIRTRPTLDALEDWILSHRATIIASAGQARRHGIQRNRNIAEFFTTRQNTAARDSQSGVREPQ